MKKHLFILILFIPVILSARQQYTIMNYNLLNYPGNDTTTRNPYFRTTMAAVMPDILVCEEMTSQAGVDGFLNNVLLPAFSGYSAGTFIDGPDTDNEIFFKTEFFTFISNTPIATDLRNISEFKLVENSSGDTIRIYAVHLKASSGSGNEQQRLAEVNVLRGVTALLPAGSFFMVTGDFNIYGSSEPAYAALTDQSDPGYFVDIFDMPGVWNNSAYAPFHTQSTRTRQFGGGANGGLDDRFDMILMSQGIMDTGGVHYVDNSYIPYGNDGLHYNDSINQPPNLAVGQEIADALHYSSDHLPVMADFVFESAVPVELISFNAEFVNGEVQLNWITETETNNRGFEIERSGESNKWIKIGYTEGYGTAVSGHSYSFTDKNVSAGKYYYRLKQMDFNGSFEYSRIIKVNVVNSAAAFNLEQNYPNPFNPETVIDYQLPANNFVTIKVYNTLGQEIITLVNNYMDAGSHSVKFNGSKLPGGVYIYRLSAGNHTAARKLLLLK